MTTGGDAVSVPTPRDLSGSSKAVMIRDPDGYPVELVQVTPVPSSPAPAGGNILGAQMSVVVKDIDASLAFYRRFIGPGLHGMGRHGVANQPRLQSAEGDT